MSTPDKEQRAEDRQEREDLAKDLATETEDLAKGLATEGKEQRADAKQEHQDLHDRQERATRAQDRTAKYREDVTRADVASLAVLVGELGANVRDLHDLILDSMIKSEQAITTAEAAPTREEVERQRDDALIEARQERQRALLRVYLLVGTTVALLSVIAVLGSAYLVGQHKYRLQQYENCKTRNQQADYTASQNAQSVAFLASFVAIEHRAALRGDQTAKEVEALFKSLPSAPPVQPPGPVKCEPVNGLG